jgi:hypothetical protein
MLELYVAIISHKKGKYWYVFSVEILPYFRKDLGYLLGE